MSKKTKDSADQKKAPAEKKKKEKIIYIDDGSTVADMTNTRKPEKGPPRRKSTMREKWRTYISVVKRLTPLMLCTLLAFTIIFLFLLLISGRLF